MSIQQFPSGRFRAQVHHPLHGNVSVGNVLGGASTFDTREEAEAARTLARDALRNDPELILRTRQHRQAHHEERLRNRAEGARLRRDAIRTQVAQRLSESYEIDTTTGCWVWQGAGSPAGYGMVNREGRKQQAHRWFFERLVGPIPEGLHLDHLCRNRACVNPEHLDPVTCGENIRRGIEDTEYAASPAS